MALLKQSRNKQTKTTSNASKHHVRYFKERRVRAHPTTPSFAFVVGSPFVFHTQSTNNSSDLSIQLSCVVVQYSCISTKTNNLFFLCIASVHPLLHHTPAPTPPPTPAFSNNFALPSIQKDKLNNDLLKIPQLKELGEKTKVAPVFLVAGAAGFALLVLYLIFGAGLLCNLLGFVYPVYASIQAIETKGTDDDTQWLTYWVIYAFFNLIEHFSDVILHWVPFYFSFKLGLLVWMMLPTQNGATFIYQAIRSRVKTTTTESGEPTASASQGVYSEAD